MKAAACALAFLAVTAVAPAKTMTAEKLGVALDVPDDWVDAPGVARNVPPPAELIAGVTSPDGKRGITALSTALKPNEADGYTRGLLDSLTKQGFTLGAKVPVVIHGVSFDSYTGTPQQTTTPLLQVFSTLANGHAYAISIASQTGDPTQDQELQAIVQSFHFLTPPEPFQKAVDARAVGYRVGRVVGMLACPAIFILGAGAVLGGGYFFFRKKK